MSRPSSGIHRILYAGCRRCSSDARRRRLILNLMLLLSAFFLLLLGALALIQGDLFLGGVDLAVLMLLLLLYGLHGRYAWFMGISLTSVVVAGALYTVLLAHGGVEQTAFIWIFTYPIIAVLLLGVRLGSAASLLFSLSGLTVVLLPRFGLPGAFYSTQLIQRMAALYVLVYLFALIMEVTHTNLARRLKKATKKQASYAERLLMLNGEREQLIQELQANVDEVQTLKRFLPICYECKKIRDDDGYWKDIEVYFDKHTESMLTHSICPDCGQRLYGEFYNPNTQLGE